MEIMILIGLVIAAILAVESNILIRSILFLEVFSLLAVVTYTILNAPDVALAEVVIGCLFSTILLLIALREKKIFRIGYFRTEDIDAFHVEKYFLQFAQEYELQLDVVERDNELSLIRDRRECDIIVRIVDGDYHIYYTKKVFKRGKLTEWIESGKLANAIILDGGGLVWNLKYIV